MLSPLPATTGFNTKNLLAMRAGLPVRAAARAVSSALTSHRLLSTALSVCIEPNGSAQRSRFQQVVTTEVAAKGLTAGHEHGVGGVESPWSGLGLPAFLSGAAAGAGAGFSGGNGTGQFAAADEPQAFADLLTRVRSPPPPVSSCCARERKQPVCRHFRSFRRPAPSPAWPSHSLMSPAVRKASSGNVYARVISRHCADLL